MNSSAEKKKKSADLLEEAAVIVCIVLLVYQWGKYTVDINHSFRSSLSRKMKSDVFCEHAVRLPTDVYGLS